MRALPWVAAAALFLGVAQADEKPPMFRGQIIPMITPDDVAACEADGGCLVISRGKLRDLIAEKERMALQACRNLL